MGFRPLNVVAILIHLLLASVAVTAALSPPSSGTHAHQRHAAPCHGDSSSSATFPLITWFRNSVIELVFGKHPSSASSTSTPFSPGGHASSRIASFSSASSSSSSYALYQPARYSKQTVIRFNVTTPDEEAALAEAAERLFLDVWGFDNYTGTVDIRLNREDVSSLLTLLPLSLHRAYSPLIPNLAVAVQDSFPSRTTGRGGSAQKGGSGVAARLSAFVSSGSTSVAGMTAALGNGVDNVFFQDYQPLPVIEQWMKLMDVMFPFVQMMSVGQSAEGREILGLRVGASRGDNGDNSGGDRDAPDEQLPLPRAKKTILVTGGLHAREWITTSTVNYVAWSLISGYGKAGMITKLLDHFDVVFVPVVNPDGYEYTWNTDRLWRKTRQGTSFRYCRGLDLDHAFGYAWGWNDDGSDGGDGDASDPPMVRRQGPCSETYGGEAAFQAVEARSLAAWARSEVVQRGVEFVGFLDLHSYSQQILFPFSYSCATRPPNLENLEELAAGLAKAIRLSSGELYSISSACEGILSYGCKRSNSQTNSKTNINSRIETGGGSAIDWFYHELRARYSYQIKLRDTGSYGFLLPASEIVPTGEEIFSAFKYFGDFLLGNNGIERSLAEDEEVAVAGVEKEQDASKDAKLEEGEFDMVDYEGEDEDNWGELRRRRRK